MQWLNMYLHSFASALLHLETFCDDPLTLLDVGSSEPPGSQAKVNGYFIKAPFWFQTCIAAIYSRHLWNKALLMPWLLEAYTSVQKDFLVYET